MNYVIACFLICSAIVLIISQISVCEEDDDNEKL